MSKKHKVIHDSDFTLIGDFFKALDRQGPCSEEATLKALSFIEELPADAKIVDAGCGTGGQTITLAKNTTGHITAIDLMPAFIESLQQAVKWESLADRITPVTGSMGELPFDEQELDLIWAEGSIYHIGFKYGLSYFNRFIKPGGYLVASEVSWFTDERPEEIAGFWHENYPEIDTIPTKVVQMQQAGFVPLAHFVMPQTCWWNYFNPIRDNYSKFLHQQGNSRAAKDLISHFEHEIGLYDKYKEYYGYVFYIGRKV